MSASGFQTSDSKALVGAVKRGGVKRLLVVGRLATPSRRQLDDAMLRPLIDDFLPGARSVGAEERSELFRLAWDFVGSSLAGRNVLYGRFYLTPAAPNRIPPTSGTSTGVAPTRSWTGSWRPAARRAASQRRNR